MSNLIIVWTFTCPDWIQKWNTLLLFFHFGDEIKNRIHMTRRVSDAFAAWRGALSHSSAFVKFINLLGCRIKCSSCRRTQALPRPHLLLQPSPTHPPLGLGNILRAIILGTSRCQLELATRCKFQDTKSYKKRGSEGGGGELTIYFSPFSTASCALLLLVLFAH